MMKRVVRPIQRISGLRRYNTNTPGFDIPRKVAELDYNRWHKYLFFTVVPQNYSVSCEFLGKYRGQLEPGFHLLLPFLHQLPYSHSLMQQMLPISEQPAFDKEGVKLHLDAQLYLKCIDPEKASYNSRNPYQQAYMFAMAATRNATSQKNLDDLLSSRVWLNEQVEEVLRHKYEDIGMQLGSYEILDIRPNEKMAEKMALEAEAERDRREAKKQADATAEVDTTTAQGAANAERIKSEGSAAAIENLAAARAIETKLGAEAQAKKLEIEGTSIRQNPEATQLQIVRESIAASGKIVGQSNTLVLSSELGDASKMFAPLLAQYKILSATLEKPNAEKPAARRGPFAPKAP